VAALVAVAGSGASGASGASSGHLDALCSGHSGGGRKMTDAGEDWGIGLRGLLDG